MKKMTRAMVVNATKYDGSNKFPPSEFLEFRDWFLNVSANIPSQYLGSAEIVFTASHAYEGDIDLTCEVSYAREETDEEAAARKQKERELAAARVAREIVEFNRLKLKYGEK